MSKKIPRRSIRDKIAAWRQGRNKGASAARKRALIGTLKIALVVALIVGAGALLRYLEIYVRSTPVENGTLELLDVPSWVNWDLKERVIEAAGGDHIPIKEETAAVVARNLTRVSWLAGVSVDVTHNTIQVKAQWRKPVVLLERGSQKFYVDKDLVILDYMPMAHLPIVDVKGVSMAFPPEPGKRADCNDLAAAVKLIDLLCAADAQYSSSVKNPILEHIASVDVSNYKGRKNRESHIVLNSKEGTQILWGAELGEWAMHFEAKDEEKLAKLYVHFHEHGSLGGDIKYIDLSNPDDHVPQPIDKYR